MPWLCALIMVTAFWMTHRWWPASSTSDEIEALLAVGADAQTYLETIG
jgi:hypothetical protein